MWCAEVCVGLRTVKTVLQGKNLNKEPRNSVLRLLTAWLSAAAGKPCLRSCVLDHHAHSPPILRVGFMLQADEADQASQACAKCLALAPCRGGHDGQWCAGLLTRQAWEGWLVQTTRAHGHR